MSSASWAASLTQGENASNKNPANQQRLACRQIPGIIFAILSWSFFKCKKSP
jgi:hypothetical protein